MEIRYGVGNITDTQLIWITITRIYPNKEWEGLSHQDIVQALTQKTHFRKMEKIDFFGYVQDEGAAINEVAQLYSHSKFIEDLEVNLRKGDLRAMQILSVMAQGLIPNVGQQTVDAINNAIQGHSLRMVDVVAEEFGVEVPAAIDLALVGASLSEFG